MSLSKRSYVLMNRDGVINRRPTGGCVSSWNQFEFLPRALEALRLLTANGWMVLLVSNQPGIGSGVLSTRELQALTRRFLLEVALAGGRIVKVYYCPHIEADGCLCRKPFPGLLLRAMNEHFMIPNETYMVGDSDCDMEAAARAGCKGIRLRRDAFLTVGVRRDEGSEIASNLYEAAEEIVRRGIPLSHRIVDPAEPISRIEDPLAVSLLNPTEGTCS